MSSPSPFAIGNQIGNNFANSRQQASDSSSIESILSDAMRSGDSKSYQNAIGQILSKVSPQNQGAAVQYLQNATQNLMKQDQLQYARGQDQHKMQREQEAAEQGGYSPYAPPQVQAEQVKAKAKAQRLQQYGMGGGDPRSPENLPNAQNGTTPYLSGIPNQEQDPNNSDLQQPTTETQQSPFKALTDDQLIQLTGAPDRELSEPAKAELKSRSDQKKIDLRTNENWTKFGRDRAEKVLDKVEDISHSLPVKTTALDLMEDAIANGNLEFFSNDNLAEITGISAFRTPEGALFKTAIKEFLLGNINRAGTRPNQWIEQQILEMLPKIGTSDAASLSVVRALRNEIELDKERVRLTNETYDQLRDENKDIGQLGPIVNKKLSSFAENKQNELFNDLRAIKAIDSKSKQSYHKVAPGTKISKYMIESLLEQFDDDQEKAFSEAKKLGYS